MELKAKDIPSNIGIEGINFVGKVKTVYGRKTGSTPEYGDWSFQNLVVEDETGEVTVSLRNREEITKEVVGRKIALNSTFVEKMQKNMGVKIIKEDYLTQQGEPREVIKLAVTGSANIVWGEEYKPEPAVAPAQVEQIKGASDEKQRLLKAQDRMLTVLSWVSEVSQFEKLKPLAFSPMEWEKIATTMFIQLNR